MLKPNRLVSVVAMVAMLLVSGTAPVSAQRRGGNLQLLSDAETEHTIREMARPIFSAAGVDPEAVHIVLVNDPSLNAFVAGGQNIFIHTGLLLDTSAEQLIGVIAHETGHIAGGHLVRGSEAMENSFLSSLLGIGIGIAGGIASGNAGAGMAGLMLGQHLAERNYLAFSRGQEASADQAALSYMDQAGVSARGLYDFLEKLGAGEPLITQRDSDAPYRLTHPLSRERMEAVRAHVERSRYSDRTLPADEVALYERIQAKLYAYLDPAGALRRFPESDRSIAARYGRTYAYLRRGEVERALPLADGLIAEEPKNAFFYETKGDLLLQTGRAADAVAPYRKAVEYAPDAAPIRVSLAHALLEQNDPRLADEAIKNLQVAARSQARSAFLWRLMAQAWNMKGNQAMVTYASAEEALARGDKPMALALAERAEKMLPAGSPAWLRAQDIRGQAGRKD
ncbi:M48 family metalloprotease [Azospirillum sp. A39]|uniref:M48 family metalloprotease n=1 Tax=Azospirillum sp. A39 TaxID=3462279 RepID=UPI0040457DF5